MIAIKFEFPVPWRKTGALHFNGACTHQTNHSVYEKGGYKCADFRIDVIER